MSKLDDVRKTNFEDLSQFISNIIAERDALREALEKIAGANIFIVPERELREIAKAVLAKYPKPGGNKG